MQKVDIILLAGGKGKRFHPVTGDKIAKSLYRLNDLELIKYSIQVIDFSLVRRLIFALDHHAEMVKEWVEQQDLPCEVYFSRQDQPGVLGAVEAAEKFIVSDNFIVCNTDEIREGLSMRRLVEFHEAAPPSVLATMAATVATSLYHHRVLVLDDANLVLKTELKNSYYEEYPDITKPINTGFIIFKKQASKFFNDAYGGDWSAIINPLVDRHAIQALVNPSISYFNVGTLQELEEASEYITHRRSKPVLVL